MRLPGTKILFAAAEAAPIAKVGGLADVVGSLPAALRELGADIRVVLPVYKSVSLSALGAEHIFTFGFQFLGQDQQVGVFRATIPDGQTPVYLLDNHEYFGSCAVYEDPGAGVGGTFEIEKFTFFCRAIAEFIQRSGRLAGWEPDVLHCHDWHVSAAILALKFGKYQVKPKTVLTIHNLAMQGRATVAAAAELGIKPSAIESITSDPSAARGVNLLRQGIIHADSVTTVSPTYAREILTPEFGEGLEDVLAARGVTGILNGIDTDTWNSATDTFALHEKHAAKTRLQESVGLAQNPGVPLVAIVSRLTQQKGFDLLPQVERELLAMEFQFVVLGVGEESIEAFFERFKAERPGACAVVEKFDERLAHQIYAGADVFLMPSRFEPCGLGQMIAMRYGTVPVVHATGGLADTVQDGVDGFSFTEFSAHELLKKFQAALALYSGQPEIWQALKQSASSRDFSWSHSAEKYADLYGNLGVSIGVARR